MRNVIVIQEMSAGNQEVGHMWHETKIFHEGVPIKRIIEWREGLSGNPGRTIITVESDK